MDNLAKSGVLKLLVLPVDVGYAHPNPDGSRKKCGNCWKYRTEPGICLEVKGSLLASDVCNLHVFGAPDSAAPASKLDWSESGVVRPGKLNGTACESCAHVHNGLCLVNADPHTGKPPVKVEAKGCCNRWRAKSASPP